MSDHVVNIIASLVAGERWLAKDTDQHRPARHDIARLAYRLYVARGRQDGHDIDDWLRAEQQIAHADRAHEAREPGRSREQG